MNDDGWKKACRMLSRLNSPEEASKLLEILLTPSEKSALSERCAILKLLQKGYTQRHVRDIANTSIATVSRGARVLNEYRSVLEKHLSRIG